VMATMEVQQDARMRCLGLNFSLNEEAYATFYRNLVGENLGKGYVVLAALTVGEEVVATLLGIRNGTRYVMVRFSNAGEKWARCSPGLLVIERTMAALHANGVRSFDFGTGNYAYKRKFGVTRLPLLNVTKALSWRGKPFALRDRIVRELRRYPRLAARISRTLGTQSAREEE
jgi:CelD/BcsL family acetyltransferase involved in cellulose biosynthesis